ncbi:MAG: autotransporter domain-containing protein, partial [bacterium]
IYRKIEEKEYGVTISLGTYISFIDNVRNISETSEILKSSPINSGVDLKLELVKNINLFGLKFYPSVSITGSYGLVQNYKEKGGSGSALEVKAHNVLATKPEVGFRFE